MYPEKITWKDKESVNDPNYKGIEFPVSKNDSSITEVKKKKKKKLYQCFLLWKELIFPTYFSDQKFENSMDLLLIIDEKKSHYVYIKDFDRFIFHKTKKKNKRYSCKICLQCFSSTNVLNEHKKVCLSNSGVQSVGLEKRTIEFKNLFK